MPSGLKGYVVEPVRVGGANAVTTPTPTNLVSNPGAFAAHYPQGSEPAPRTDVLVLVQEDGLLATTARFGWTRNEVIARFDYAGADQRFVPLPGLPAERPGLLTLDANTTRLKVTPPQQALADAPFRLSVGPGVGTTLTVALVTSFGAPSLGTVELLITTGELNWNTADLAFYAGDEVRFQRQSFAGLRESDGQLGVIEDVVLLCPLPASSQYPLVRLGYGTWLTPVARANDAALSSSSAIPSGTVEWSASTGLLRFSSVDMAAKAGSPVFYDGVLFGWKLALPTVSAGTVSSPVTLSTVPADGSDVIVRLATGYQFPLVRRVTTFDAGTAGEVQLKPTGELGFSATDQGTYGATAVTVTVGDLLLERGLSVRFFRNPINLDAAGPDKDVSSLYAVTNAIWADPIIAAPAVFLPSRPLDTALTVTVAQGTGSYVGTLPRLDGASPPAGLGYILDFSDRQLVFAKRVNDALVTLGETKAVAQLPDPLVLASNLVVGLEVAAGSGVYTTLTPGVDALVDAQAGQVSFLTTQGTLLLEGQATVGGTTLALPSTAGLLPGDYVSILSGPAKGVVQIAAVLSSTLVQLDATLPTAEAPYEIRRGAEVLADRAWLPAVPVDPSLAVDRLTPLGPAANATVIHAYTLTFSDATTAQGTGFLTDGVQPGDTLRLTSGPDVGSARRIVAATATALTVDRPFTSLAGGTATVERRLSLKGEQVRLGAVYVTPTVVATDSAFTSPAPGAVQVSQETGNLQFSTGDLGKAVAQVARLTRGVGYRVTAGLGFVELTDRLLAYEEVRITYRTVDAATGLPSSPLTEQAAFLVRKELTTPTPRPDPTSILSFNPTGRTLAALPPAIFRGGRPQTAAQVNVDMTASTLTFAADVGFQTDALPHGATVGTTERVYVDYYVTQAFGGERTFTVQQPPLYVTSVTLEDGADSFTVAGDQTSVFPQDTLLRVEKQAVYRLLAPTYDAGSDQTTVSLAGGATFTDDAIEPGLEVTSGAMPLMGSFVPEPSQWGPLPRGATKVVLPGDRTTSYRAGTVVAFTLGGQEDAYLVVGSSVADGKTTVTFGQPLVREARSQVMRRSIRPVVEAGTTSFPTSLPPVISQGYTVVRRTSGQLGQVQATGLDDSGTVQADSLGPDESLLLFYSGYRLIEAGRRVKASYTATIAPGADNGLLGQVLLASHALFSPDTITFRVETLTTFLAEVTLAYQKAAQAQSPTAGPMTSNTSSPKLWEQGRPSVFFDELHLANVDLVARVLLQFYHDSLGHLEDVVQSAQGTVVGSSSGRFRFDGQIGNPARVSPGDITNDIDDRFQVSPFPTKVVWNPPAVPVVTYVGTFQPLWQPSSWSRLYPTTKAALYGLTVGGSDTGAATGDAIEDLGQTLLTSTPSVAYRRWPRAQLVKAAVAGATTLEVDNARGTAVQLRPAFASGMKVVILAQDGTPLVSDASPLTVSSVAGSPERLVVGALPVAVPAGATVMLCTTGAGADTSYAKSYRLGMDIKVDETAGTLTYIKPYFPFDGSVPLIPSELCVQPPASGEFLQLDQVGVMTGTVPFRFPALDGLPLTDNGDTGLPMQGLTYEQEADFLAQEVALLTLMAASTPPSVYATVGLDVGRTVLTNTSGSWPAPVPQAYDLVRFLDGPNATAGWRRVNTVSGNLAGVDVAFPTVTGTTWQAEFTAAPNVATGTATFPSATVLNDPALSASIQPGMTVVLLSGANQGLRRQVVRRISSTQLELSAAVTLVSTTYRVHQPLSTYSQLPTVALAGQRRTLTLNDRHSGAKADALALAVTRFLDGDGQAGVLTTLVSSTGTAAGALLTDTSQNFVTLGLTPGDFVLIEAGANQGVWPLASVAPTALTLGSALPSAGATVYRAVRAYGVGKEALQGLFAVRQAAVAADAAVQAWQGQLVTQPVTVPPGVVDATFFVTGLTAAQVASRQAAVTARQAAVAAAVATVGAVTTNRDKLYARRWSWITARVDGVDGLLYQQGRAVARRVDAQAKLVQQLLQLASLGGTS